MVSRTMDCVMAGQRSALGTMSSYDASRMSQLTIRVPSMRLAAAPGYMPSNSAWPDNIVRGLGHSDNITNTRPPRGDKCRTEQPANHDHRNPVSCALQRDTA